MWNIACHDAMYKPLSFHSDVSVCLSAARFEGSCHQIPHLLILNWLLHVWCGCVRLWDRQIVHLPVQFGKACVYMCRARSGFSTQHMYPLHSICLEVIKSCRPRSSLFSWLGSFFSCFSSSAFGCVLELIASTSDLVMSYRSRDWVSCWHPPCVFFLLWCRRGAFLLAPFLHISSHLWSSPCRKATGPPSNSHVPN